MRAFSCALLAALLCVSTACKHRNVGTIEDGSTPALASAVHLADPRSAHQLAAGFWDVEARAWRWSKRQFAVVLRPPKGSAQKGATLSVTLTVPPVIIEKETSVTLSAAIGDTKLASETWSKAGNYVFKADVPAAILAGDSVRIDFELDKAMPPSDKDARELGIVVSRVGLVSK